MKIEITKEDLKEIIDQEVLVEGIVYQIVKDKKNKTWNEFDGELLSAIRTATKEIVKEYISEYDGENEIKNLIEREIRSLTKKEIVEVFYKTLNQ